MGHLRLCVRHAEKEHEWRESEVSALKRNAASKNMAAVADVTIKWSGKEYVINGLSETQTVLDLKEEIRKQTNVLPIRQKLLGLKYKGNSVSEAVLSPSD